MPEAPSSSSPVSDPPASTVSAWYTLPSQEGGTHVEVVAHDEHRRVAARALALDLDHRELAVLGGLPRLNAPELLTYGVQDPVRAAQHARCSGAHLHKVFADWLSDACASV